MIVAMKKPAEELAHQPVIIQANPANPDATGELYRAQSHPEAVTAAPLEIWDWCKQSGEHRLVLHQHIPKLRAWMH